MNELRTEQNDTATLERGLRRKKRGRGASLWQRDDNQRYGDLATGQIPLTGQCEQIRLEMSGTV
jgi:hypothetical protein